MIRALALASISMALLASGCGGDGSGEPTRPSVSIPAVTAPIPATTTGPPTTIATQTGSTPTNPGGHSRNGFDPGKPDSATNDVPPPAGSPQETFEKQCRQNPSACG